MNKITLYWKYILDGKNKNAHKICQKSLGSICIKETEAED
jgi:hypothetical protein